MGIVGGRLLPMWKPKSEKVWISPNSQIFLEKFVVSFHDGHIPAMLKKQPTQIKYVLALKVLYEN